MTISVQRDAGKARINLPERFDMSAQAIFRQAYAEVIGNGDVREIEVDFNAVAYIDSSALGSLLLLRQRAEQSAQRIVLSKCQPEVMRVLAIANFHRIFSIH